MSIKEKKIMQLYFLTAKSKNYEKHLITNINKNKNKEFKKHKYLKKSCQCFENAHINIW